MVGGRDARLGRCEIGMIFRLATAVYGHSGSGSTDTGHDLNDSGGAGDGRLELHGS